MRMRTTTSAVAAAAVLSAAFVAPAGAGTLAILTVDPNPAHVGETVTITPVADCPDFELGTPEVVVEVTGPEDDTFTITPTYDEGTARYAWDAQLTAGPVGVYTIEATCYYSAPPTDSLPRQALPTFPYASATLQVIAQVTVPTTAAPTTTTTSASSTTTTAAPAAAATPAAPVAASPRFTG